MLLWLSDFATYGFSSVICDNNPVRLNDSGNLPPSRNWDLQLAQK
jgi:hypothetical protein